jgi:hypothetical protein
LIETAVIFFCLFNDSLLNMKEELLGLMLFRGVAFEVLNPVSFGNFFVISFSRGVCLPVAEIALAGRIFMWLGCAVFALELFLFPAVLPP